MTRVLHRSTKQNFDVAVSGDGMMLTLADGGTVIDAAGGAAVACIGHGNARVAEAIAKQAKKLAYVHTLFFSTEPAEELADFLVGHEPGGLTRAFFVSSGSEAMESALKLAFQYHVERGESQRRHFIARRQSYHGNTFGALAASGHPGRRSIYEPILMPNFSHVSPCFAFRYKTEHESSEQYVARLAAELEAEFERLGPENVAAFVAEPIVGATSGCVAAEPGYFKAVREICDRYGALLILDEIMSGMGRSGTQHVWEQEGITPDLQAVAKGLSGGYVPLGALLVSGKVMNALETGTGAFVHGHTFQAHAVACAGALEVQKIIEEENLLDNVKTIGGYLTQALNDRFGQHNNVADIRGRGLFQALEFVQSRNANEPYAPALRFSEVLKRKALDVGLAIYPNGGTIDGTNGDHVIIAPPYNAKKSDVDAIVSRLGSAIDAAARSV
jgi:adenosylmethionine-8-amino-7-oxononanoate aminotransferase